MESDNMEKMDFFNEKDLDVRYSKSGGPGGQNVNKRETSVQVRIDINDLNLSEEKKAALRKNIPESHLTKEGIIIASNSEERSRKRNEESAKDGLKEVIKKYLEAAKEEEKTEKHKERVNSRIKKGGGGSKQENIKERQKQKFRSERTEDLLEEALESDPDLRKRLSDQ